MEHVPAFTQLLTECGRRTRHGCELGLRKRTHKSTTHTIHAKCGIEIHTSSLVFPFALREVLLQDSSTDRRSRPWRLAREIQFDCALAKTEDDIDMLKFANMRWRQTGATATFNVRQKGPIDEYVLKGMSDLFFKTDQESSCVQLATDASQKRQHKTIVEATPQGSKGSIAGRL